MGKTTLEYYNEALEEVLKTSKITKEPSLLDVIAKIREHVFDEGRTYGYMEAISDFEDTCKAKRKYIQLNGEY